MVVSVAQSSPRGRSLVIARQALAVNTGANTVSHLDMDDGAECTFGRFADNTGLNRLIDMPEGCARRAMAGWRNRLALAKGSVKSGMWGGTAPWTCTIWGQMAGKQLCRGVPGFLGGQAEHEPAMWQKTRNRWGALFRVSTADWGRWSLPVSSEEMRAHWNCVLFWASQYKRDMDMLEQVQEMAGKTIKELECLCLQRGLRLLSLETCQGDFISMCISMCQEVIEKTYPDIFSGTQWQDKR